MRLVAMLVGFATFALSGCVGPGSVDDGGGDTVAKVQSFDWDFHDCDYWFWGVPAPPEAIAARLPDGFEPASRGFAATDGPAHIGFERYVCESFTGPAGTIENIQAGAVMTRVQPPPELMEEGVSSYYYRWHTMVQDDATLDALTGLGFDNVHGGSVGLDRSLVGTADLQLTVDELGTFEAETTATEAESDQDGEEFVAFTQLADGQLVISRSILNHTSRGQAGGVATLEGGSWPAEAIGATTSRAFVAFGAWSFEGTFILPPPVDPGP